MGEYTGALWQIYLVTGVLFGWPLLSYYAVTAPAFKGYWEDMRSKSFFERGVGLFMIAMTGYTFFILIWPIALVAVIIDLSMKVIRQLKKDN